MNYGKPCGMDGRIVEMSIENANEGYKSRTDVLLIYHHIIDYQN